MQGMEAPTTSPCKMEIQFKGGPGNLPKTIILGCAPFGTNVSFLKSGAEPEHDHLYLVFQIPDVLQC